MTYSPILLVHICAGIIAVLSGFVALFVRKGSPLHRNAGNVFVLSMMFMGTGGAYIALRKAQPFNVMAGVLSFYLVVTAWLTVDRKYKEKRRAEMAMLVLALATGTAGVALGLTSTTRNAGAGFVFGFLAFFLAAGDVRMLLATSVSRAQRLARHLWRMCFALFVAAGSFFLGTAGDPAMRQNGLRARLFTREIRATHLPQLPVLIIIVLMFFWLGRVLLTDAYKRRERISRGDETEGSTAVSSTEAA
jgi:uncharacterized membrane protein